MKILPSDYVLNRYGLVGRLIEESDAEFIVSLRNGPKPTKYMNLSTFDVESQRKWIKEYKIREAKGEDYYFVFYVGDIPVGLNRLYDMDGPEFSTGSWVFSEESPFGASFLAQVMVRELAFIDLGLTFERVEHGVFVENKSVLKYDLMVGMKTNGLVFVEGLGDFYRLTLSKEDFFKGRDKILKMCRIPKDETYNGELSK